MAEGGHISSSSGSDLIYDFYCELCVEDGKHLDAQGYCTNCKEYLCEECYHSHKRTRSTRNHVLVDRSNMPKSTPLSSDRVSKVISKMCESHPEEVAKFYCKTHDVFECSTCFATVHRSCQDVENILEKSENILHSQEYKYFVNKLKSMKTQSEDMLKLSRDNKTILLTRCTEAVSVARQVKEEAILILEQIENNFVELATKLRSEGEEQIENLEKEFSALAEKIDTVNSEVESLWSAKRVCQLYIRMKEAEKEVTSLTESLRNAERKNVVKTPTFEPNLELKSYLNSPDILGKILYQVEVAETISPISSDEPSENKATSVDKINLRSKVFQLLYDKVQSVLKK